MRQIYSPLDGFRSPFGRLMGSTAPFTPAVLFGASEPGVWYDPSDVANLAWRRNLLTYSEVPTNAAWEKSNVSVTGQTVTATGTSGPVVRQNGLANAAGTYTFKPRIQRLTSDWCVLFISDAVASYVAAWVNLATGDLGSVNSVGSGWSGSATIQTVSTGVYDVTLTVTKPSSANSHTSVHFANADGSFTGVLNSTLGLIRAQLELGSVATDYQRISDVNTEVIERFPSATLYQDTAGTTPVTTPGQTVALALDKSKGGRQTLPTTGWAKTSGDGTVTVDGNTITITGATTTTRVDIAAPGFAVGDYADITVTGSIAGATGATLFLGGSAAYSTLSGTNTFRNVISASNLLRVQISTGSATFVIPSRGYVPGFHATQATLASRPTYGIVPLGGRRNLLTRTEEFENAVWVKASGATISANTTVAPSGTTTADTFSTVSGAEITQSVTVISGAAYRVSLSFAKTSGATVFPMLALNGSAAFGQVIINTNTGVAAVRSGLPGATSVTVTDQTTFWRLSFTFAPDTTNAALKVYAAASTDGTSFTGGLSGSCIIWGAQLETGSTATAYQRVGSAFDVTEAGVASLSYLSFDGVDDFLVTPTITPGIDKAQVFAGVRKLSDAAAGTIAEMSAAFFANNGSFALFAAGSTAPTGFEVVSRGTANALAGAASAAPVTNVLAGIGDISGDRATLRINGTQVAQSTADQGAGNYLAYQLFIGRRAGTSLGFNGQIYSLIVRFGTNLDAGTITSTETWVAGKTGVTL